MSFPRRQFLRLTAAAAVLPAMSHVGWAQGYPTRQVRVIVSFALGGPPDTAARLLAQRLSDSLGKQFYVENLPGGSGNTGTGQAARATPDGYTVLVTVNNIVINPPLFEKVPYDPYKDFDPVSLAVSYSSVLAVNPTVPANAVAELVALIKANPGKYSYASPGFGTPTHLLGEQLRVALGLDLVHVPFCRERACDRLDRRRPYADRIRRSRRRRAVRARRQAAPARRHEPESVECLAECSHYCGRGLLGPRRRWLGRSARSSWYAEAAGNAGARPGRHHARGVRAAASRRRREMGEGDPRRQH